MESGAIIQTAGKLGKEQHCELAVITGGEPLEQDLGLLVPELHAAGFLVALETNGIHYQALPFDHVAVSPKPAAGFAVNEGWQKINELKLVAEEGLSFDSLRDVAGRFPGVPVFLQPDRGRSGSFARCRELFCRAHRCGLVNVRLGVQLQLLYGID